MFNVRTEFRTECWSEISPNADPPILDFFDFLACCVFQFSLLFVDVFPFSKTLGVPRREKPLLFSGFPFFFQKARVRGSGKFRVSPVRGLLKGWGNGGNGRGGIYTREMGTLCPFGIFPLFYSIFCFKIGHFPFKT